MWQATQQRQRWHTAYDEQRCHHHQHQMLYHVGLQQHLSEPLEGRCQRQKECEQTGLETPQTPDSETLQHLTVQLPPATKVEDCTNDERDDEPGVKGP